MRFYLYNIDKLGSSLRNLSVEVTTTQDDADSRSAGYAVRPRSKTIKSKLQRETRNLDHPTDLSWSTKDTWQLFKRVRDTRYKIFLLAITFWLCLANATIQQ